MSNAILFGMAFGFMWLFGFICGFFLCAVATSPPAPESKMTLDKAIGIVKKHSRKA